ncbi:MAG TPA: SDR family NAD(P)-dependent oxidoreductase, partial [Anaerolineales bacterium]|nr:SDR family NAD(P)-dependent oxidoreductase [Anaerolineales bacterium]
MPSDFDGQVAFVTGAAHGQGRATALALAREGARIVAFDVARQLEHPGYALGAPEDLQSLHDEVVAAGSEALIWRGDVRDDSAISAAVKAAIGRFGKIDILVNNAGICFYGLSHELSEDAWD